MLIIYHVITTYHLMEAWVHSLLNYNKEQDIIILLYDDVLEDKYPMVRTIPNFNTCIPVPYRKSPRDINKLDEWMDNIFSELNSIKADEIYVAGAQFYYSYYLIKHGIPFIFFEEASGRLSKPEVVMENDKVLNMCRFDIAYKNSMYTGDNPIVKYKIGNKHAQLKDYSFENTQHFDLMEQIALLPDEKIEQILKFFDAPVGYHLSKDTAVVLTQHFTNLRMMNLEQQIELYQSTIDFYLENKDILIKLHPDDQVCYNEFIRNCRIISKKFPSELLPYIFDDKINTIATISSTGIFSFMGVCDRVLYFNTLYEKNYKYNCNFYVALYSIKMLCSVNANILYLGENFSQLSNMVSYVNFNNQFRIYSEIDYNNDIDVIILDSFDYLFKTGIMLDDIDKCLTIILNPDMFSVIENEFIMGRIRRNLVIKQIRTNQNGKNFIYKIGWYTKERKMNILEFECTKELKCSNGKFTVTSESEIENELQITKGILEATEKRLLYYIEKEKEYDKKRHDQIGS